MVIQNYETKVGVLAIVHEPAREDRWDTARILVCTQSHYVPSNSYTRAHDIEDGWYTEYAEPTAEQRETDEYRALAAKVDERRAGEAIRDRAAHAEINY